MSKPKRHHFVPQMVLRRFTDGGGHLYFVDRRNLSAGVQRARPENLLLERHLYSRIHRDGTLDPALESRYAKLEGAVSPLVDEIVKCVLGGTVPKLNDNARKAWDVFLYEQWRRVPDLHNKIMPVAAAETAVLDAIDAFERLHRPLTPTERQENLTSRAVSEFRHNAKVGALTRASKQILDILGGKGLLFGVCAKRHSFIIGSSPVLKIAPGTTSRLDDPTVEVWLPIHPNIVAVAGGSRGDAQIAHIPQAQVRSFNRAVAKKSSAIVGRSKELIASIARDCFNP